MPRHPYSTGRARKKHQQVLYMKFGIGGAVAFIVVVGLLLLLRQDSVLISTISFKGLNVLTESELKPLVETQLAGSYAFLVPRSSSFFYPKRSIEHSLLVEQKRINEVKASREDFTHIQVSVLEREPAGIWCMRENDSCYLLDENGYIFAESPSFTGDVYFKYHGIIEGNPIGTNFLPPDEFHTLVFFVAKMKELSLAPISLSLIDDEYAITLKEGGKVIFVRGDSLDRVLENLETALKAPSFKDRSLKDLEYIDLRFPNRVVHKWKQSAEESNTLGQ